MMNHQRNTDPGSPCHEAFMKRAIEKTKEGIAKGQSPFGACIVKTGDILACCHNTVWADTDITAHAEVAAIREACKKINSVDLSGAVIYSTCEPCPMCFAAIHWARINTIVFGASIDDADDAGFNELKISNETLVKIGDPSVTLIKGVCREECVALFGLWLQMGGHRSY